MSSPEPNAASTPCRQYGFADFTLDLEDGFLRRGAEEIVLRPKAFEVLAYLVEHQGRLVTKDALMNAVWPDTEVTDNSLARCLLEIRRALDDDSQQMIRTLPRRGYIFTLPVTIRLAKLPVLPAHLPAESVAFPASSGHAARLSINHRAIGIGLAFAAIAVGVLITVWRKRPTIWKPTYTQITNFTDSAVAPVLSPDGRVLAFLRSDTWLGSPDQVYVKSLPDGEPVQLTDDPRLKWGLAFSPDGSRLAYGTAEFGADGNRGDPQQAEASSNKLLPGADGDQSGDR
jgi:DNA-binding winged helix-turn-helix (wHTH) protein